MKKTIYSFIALITIGCCGSTLSGPQLNSWETTAEDIKLEPPVEKEECSQKKIEEIVAPYSKNDKKVVVDCKATLNPFYEITKKVIFQGKRSSGASLDCNGAAINSENLNKNSDIIDIRSKKIINGWENTHDIKIKNCKIFGSVRVRGMAMNAGGSSLKESSKTKNHTTTVRKNAPYNIEFNNVEIKGRHRIPLYFAPGVHHSKILRSKIYGNSASTMMYFDAESYNNIIKNSLIMAKKAEREGLALDGSSFNTIENNKFTGIDDGGIFLYRNCGENGNIRHATPRNNKITENLFVGENKSIAVYLGSRGGNRCYCDEDEGFPYGSSKSDHDHARYNVVSSNILYGAKIKVGNKTNHSNKIEDNFEK